jgi:hypothetical protein
MALLPYRRKRVIPELRLKVGSGRAVFSPSPRSYYGTSTIPAQAGQPYTSILGGRGLLTPIETLWPGSVRIGKLLATPLATVRLAIPGNHWPPLVTRSRKPQEDHPPGASRIILPRHYFEDRRQSRPEYFADRRLSHLAMPPSYCVGASSLRLDQIVRDWTVPLRGAHSGVSEQLPQSLQTASLPQPSARERVPHLLRGVDKPRHTSATDIVSRHGE